jgi:hypothetical protein
MPVDNKLESGNGVPLARPLDPEKVEWWAVRKWVKLLWPIDG